MVFRLTLDSISEGTRSQSILPRCNPSASEEEDDDDIVVDSERPPLVVVVVVVVVAVVVSFQTSSPLNNRFMV